MYITRLESRVRQSPTRFIIITSTNQEMNIRRIFSLHPC